MVASNASPTPDNYYIGKGVVSLSTDGGTTFRDVCNVPEFEFSPTIEKRDHYSSRGGVRMKDKTFLRRHSRPDRDRRGWLSKHCFASVRHQSPSSASTR
jgi:hypothetical protein